MTDSNPPLTHDELDDSEREEQQDQWPPQRVWLPDGVVMLAAVSPELENVDGAYWLREGSALIRKLAEKIAGDLAYLEDKYAQDEKGTIDTIETIITDTLRERS